MKYRILRKGDWYFPQYKGLFFWRYLEDGRGEYASLIMNTTLEAAQAAIDKHISDKARYAVKQIFEYQPDRPIPPAPGEEPPEIS